jgi:hypothetical protein
VVQDELAEKRLRPLGEEVVRVAEGFARDPALHGLPGGSVVSFSH